MDEQKLHIRKAELADVEKLSSLLTELFSIEQDFEPDDAKQTAGLSMLIESPEQGVILIATYDNDIIGMVSLQILISTAQGSKVGLIEDMVISSRYRKMGIGEKLLNEMENWAKNNSLTRLQLLADVDNHPALKFYAKNNWQSTKLIALRKMI
ncbi:MAG: GNAT family N-acetyltransferase [Sedimentisphaeraceae bacterium JB056]